MNIKTEYELVKQRGVELNPDENFDVQLYGAWRYSQRQCSFWRRTCYVLAVCVAALLLNWRG